MKDELSCERDRSSEHPVSGAGHAVLDPAKYRGAAVHPQRVGAALPGFRDCGQYPGPPDPGCKGHDDFRHPGSG